MIYSGSRGHVATNINGYLLDAENYFIESRGKPICDVPEIGMGNQPIDDGNYLFTFEEMNEFIDGEPKAVAYFHPWYGAVEFINRRPRYCLWLGDCTPAELSKNAKLLQTHRGCSRIPFEKPTKFNREACR